MNDEILKKLGYNSIALEMLLKREAQINPEDILIRNNIWMIILSKIGPGKITSPKRIVIKLKKKSWSRIFNNLIAK